MEPGQGYYRAMNRERREGIVTMYERTALAMYRGFANRMKRYAVSNDPRETRIAYLFSAAQR
jgi:hypothetical protein